MTIVTRYAPSPTGSLHIGGARTALFSWALARHHGGRFVLRFEDTDRARSSLESEQEILDSFRWLGLDWDPVDGYGELGIPRQSERGARYAELLSPLLEQGTLYRCVCTAVELEARREVARQEGRAPGYDGRCRDRQIGPDPGIPFCLRMRVDPGGPTRWDDLIAGPSGEDASQIEDFVVARSNGSPVYHLAVVVDDHDMGVTHVLRGREHILSTPRQLLLYAALGFEAPKFAHVPLLVGANGKKLSKREGDVSVQNYRERGFTPEGVLNFLARLGWSHGDLEIFDLARFVELFSLESVGRSPSQVQDDKLLSLQQHWLQELPAKQLHAYVLPFLEREAGHSVEIDSDLAEFLDLLRPRSQTLVEMAAQARFVLVDEVEFEEKPARKHLKPEARPVLSALHKALSAVSDWSAAGLEPVFQKTCDQLQLQMGKLAQPTRVAVTGSAASPGIFETLAAVGRDRVLARLERAIAHIDALSA